LLVSGGIQDNFNASVKPLDNPLSPSTEGSIIENSGTAGTYNGKASSQTSRSTSEASHAILSPFRMNEAMRIFDSSMKPVARKARKLRNDDEEANYRLQSASGACKKHKAVHRKVCLTETHPQRLRD
jgi:hypothetical protein